MRVALLGPLEVTTGRGRVDVGGAQLRALLIRLALEAGRPVSTGSLREDLWPEAEPANPGAALQSLVSRLRRALGDEVAITTGAGWYRLEVPRDGIDAHLFERLAASGRAELRDGDPARARHTLGRALDMWRGDPLAGMGHLPFATAATLRLRELRLSAIEDRVEADLAVDPGPSLVAELEGLVAGHPLRERMRGLLMRALVATGRRAEALAAYEDARLLLSEELGSDPSPELIETHRAVLRSDGAMRPHGPGNLPAATTSFVGRQDDLLKMAAHLREGRLLTLVGPGGIGKTRLALEFASGVAGRMEGGAWVVGLAASTDPREVPRAVAAALGVREATRPGLSSPTDDAVDRLVDALSSADALIVLDDCEHVVDAAAHLVHRLLTRCPRLLIVATSREPLRVTGERLLPVLPLTLSRPASGEPGPAVQLFLDRAAAAGRDLPPTPPHAAVVTELCRRLDGLPLAIELAAARLRSMTLDELAARIDDRFRVLSGGPRTAPERHRTLRAVVAWSWDLLEQRERRAVQRLAAFHAPFTTSAAERVGVSWEMLDSLVDRSLLQRAGGAYRMLETIRQFAVEQLEAGDLRVVRAAHAACFVDTAETAAARLRGAGQLPWLARLTASRDDLLAALEFARETGDAATATRMGAALSLFWTITEGHAATSDRLLGVLRMPGPAPADASAAVALAYLFGGVLAGSPADAGAIERRAVPHPGHPATPLIRALLALTSNDIPRGLREVAVGAGGEDAWHAGLRALIRSFLHGAAGDTARMRADLATAASDFGEAGERWGRATSLTYLAMAESLAGHLGAAAESMEAAIRLTRELSAPDHFQRVWLATMHARGGDVEGARAELLDVLAARPSGTDGAMAEVELASLARLEGDAGQAAVHLDAAAGRLREGGFTGALVDSERGRLAVATGDLAAARRHLRRALRLAMSMPDLPLAALVAVGVAQLVHRRDARGAAVVLGAAHALRGADDADDPDVRRLRARLADELGAAAARTAYDEGRDMSPEAALAAITSRLDAPGGPDSDLRAS